MGPLGDNAKYVSLHYRAYSKCPQKCHLSDCTTPDREYPLLMKRERPMEKPTLELTQRYSLPQLV